MRAGQLRQRVQIQSASDVRDAHGSITRTWSTIDTVWASVEPLSGKELFEAQQVHARATVRIRMRYYEALSMPGGTAYRLVLA